MRNLTQDFKKEVNKKNFLKMNEPSQNLSNFSNLQKVVETEEDNQSPFHSDIFET